MSQWASRERTVGTSRYINVAPLLSTVNGRKVSGRRKVEDIESPSPTAPPLSSDDDGSSEEEEATSKRGDIQNTRFTTADRTTRPIAAGRTTGGSACTPTPSSSAQSLKRSQKNNPDEIEEPAKKPKLNIGNHHKTDPFGRKKTAPPRASYGNKVKQVHGSTKPAVKSEFKPVPSELASPPEKPKGLITPEAVIPSPQKKWEAPPDDASLFGSSSPEKRKPTKTNGPRPPRSKRKMPKHEPPELASPERVFKMPDFDDVTFDSDLEGMDEPQSLKKLRRNRSPTPDSGPVCPMCGKSVEQDCLDDFSNKRYMTIAQQQKFCNAHRVKSARDTWAGRGYPNIDWARLGKRIAKHYNFLQDILEGRQSYYGSIYSKAIKTGENRTLMKMTGNLTPGYYGTRGLRVMTENLIDHFSTLMRKVAVQDRVVSARGQTTFVQCVLVPELGVRLIKEDMGVDEQAARDIMKESISVGELLNEEEGDVVPFEEPSDSDPTSLLSSVGDDDETD